MSKRSMKERWRSTRRVSKECQSIAGTRGALQQHSRSITGGLGGCWRGAYRGFEEYDSLEKHFLSIAIGLKEN